MSDYFRKYAKHWTNRRRLLFQAAAVLFVVAIGVSSVFAFKVGFGNERAIHEGITANAMWAVIPSANPMFVGNVQNGVFNTDFSHQLEHEFHFDESTTGTSGSCGAQGSGNCGFNNGFNALHGMLSTARGEATTCNANGQCSFNPLFMNPLHSSFRDLAEDIVGTYLSLSTNGGCWNEPACPTDDFVGGAVYVQTEMLSILVDTDPDPDQVPAPMINFAGNVAQVKSNLDGLLGSHCRPWWSFSNECFETLELMAPNDNDFQLLAAHLRILQYEYQAYYAWQHLGHALHTTQDFFAHSNYVELAAGRKGPQCDATSFQSATLCDAALDASSGGWSAIRLPSDGQGFISSLASFHTVFDKTPVQTTLNGLPKIFGDDNFNHLQTGFFPCAGDALGLPSTGGIGVGYSQGFPYCHTATKPLTSGSAGSAGLNKDKPFDPTTTSELNHHNFDWAAISAQRMSVVLFESFMADLLGPATGNFVNATSAGAASQRVGEMAWLQKPQINVGNITVAKNGINRFPTTALQLSELSGRSAISNTEMRPGPQLRLTAQTVREILAPPITNSVMQAKPAQTAVVIPAVIRRTLPPITRPELLRPNPQPHIYVKMSPNRAFRPGERVALTVEAFDAKTGNALPGLPLSIGNMKGVTWKPIELTIALSTKQRCGSISGQSFCVNEVAPPSGQVMPPVAQYPGGGGSFTLSVVVPRMLVAMKGGPALRPGTTGTTQFEITAVDAQTHAPVPGAQVFKGAVLVGPANQPISHPLGEISRLQAKGRAGLETFKASFGPHLIVRAPGYSDVLVHYILSSN
jgi:Heterokaryon incompatibility protein Het-C